MLAQRRVARVAADPAKPAPAAKPGGWRGLAYFRLHGSPRIYTSPYLPQAVRQHAARVAALARDGCEVWTIYDNTKHGAATRNALELVAALG